MYLSLLFPVKKNIQVNLILHFLIKPRQGGSFPIKIKFILMALITKQAWNPGMVEKRIANSGGRIDGTDGIDGVDGTDETDGTVRTVRTVGTVRIVGTDGKIATDLMALALLFHGFLCGYLLFIWVDRQVGRKEGK